MDKKLMSFKTKGMNRDLSVSAFNPEFSFENINLRLSTNEGNTLMSWVNEKGTAPITLVNEKWNPTDRNTTGITSIVGTPIGTAVINSQLVIFTHSEDGDYKDHIYVLKYKEDDNTKMLCKELFHGDLNFSTEYPLETLVSYESELIQKVYWVDGRNQMRFINIVTGIDKYYKNGTPIDGSFDAIREIALDESIEIVKSYGVSNCEFPSGVIQYAFTYYNKYGQESAVFRTTPIQYISFSDRGGSADEKVNVAFKIYAKKLDKKFDYLRIYSIIRTSINSSIIKRVQDIPLKDFSTKDEMTLIYIDTNTSGDIVDPTHLLYLGGTEYIIPKTFEQKDNTLFLGNLSSMKDLSLIDPTIKEEILTANGVVNDGNHPNYPIADSNITETWDERPFLKVNVGDTIWINTLGCPENILGRNGEPAYYEGASTFKTREYYRLGIQFQNKYGKWSEPCWIGDAKWDKYIDSRGGVHYGATSNYYVAENANNDLAFSGSEKIAVLALPEFRYTISSTIQSELWDRGYRRMRAVYALPTDADKTILCQGVLNSTLYRDKDIEEGFAYAQSSWLFRVPFNPNNYHGFLDKNSTINSRNAGAVAYTSELPSMFYGRYIIGDKDWDNHSGLRQLKNGDTIIGYQDKNGVNYTDFESINYEYYIPEWDPWVGQWDDAEGNTNRIWMPYYRSTEVMGIFDEKSRYKIHDNFCTLHSPDIEFSTYFNGADINSALLKKVGYTKLTKTYGDINITTETDSIKPGKGFKHQTIDTIGTSALISGNFYEDHIVTKKNGEFKAMYRGIERSNLWPVFMWHRDGSLNNDTNRDNQSAKLKTKVIGNYRFSSLSTFTEVSDVESLGAEYYGFTEAAQLIKVNDKIYKGCIDIVVQPTDYTDFYVTGLQPDSSIDIGNENVYTNLYYWEPSFIDLPVLKIHQNYINTTDHSSTSDYVWMIQLGYTSEGPWATAKIMNDYDDGPFYYRWNSLGDEFEDLGEEEIGLSCNRNTVPIKYKSTPHIAIQLTDSIYKGIDYEAMPIVELCRNYNKDTLYGGTSDEALQAITWIPCGPIVSINTQADTKVPYKWGDTYYQRYECLKTYPYTFQDKNQVVEIGSFMLETRENIDGRYDKNRGYSNMLNVSPQNFNLINDVYSQPDNFFNYRIMPSEYYNNASYPNQITWTLSKENGADVDVWTNITLASTLSLDGSLGSINKLVRLNDQLIAFQDKGISQILYNANVQISSTEGVPIELANSGKVQGKRYITNTVGCSNKWSIGTTPRGIYFMDSNSKSIYLFNGELNSISDTMGFNTWSKENIPAASKIWTPIEFDNFVTYYDKLNQDVLFINKDTALAFSEKLGTFTSFYDYGNIPYFCNFEDTGIWIKSLNGDALSTTTLWKHQGGDYCKFFGVNKPYSMTLVGNPEPQTDKLFTNIEFRANVEGDGEYDGNTGKFTPALPFDYLEVWNEYQHGIAELSIKNGIGVSQHNLRDNTAHLDRKFRMWRCDIPRNNALLDNERDTDTEYIYSTDKELNISRYIRKPMDRMRNPWIYLKFKKNEASQSSLAKSEVHDLVMTYYNT